MTAKSKKTIGHSLKRTAIGAAIGIAVTVVISLVSTWLALKIGDPLSLAGTAAAASVLCGGLGASLAGSIMGGAFIDGVYSGTLYTALCILLSLCTPDGGGSPLTLIGAAILGVLGGCALKASRKSNTKRRMKKYVRR
ncbi:MAG: hypothetical protein IJC49_05875 [Clostridia bacterium]|nr:hypothetical protein [Clostridia bacterium]